MRKRILYLLLVPSSRLRAFAACGLNVQGRAAAYSRRAKGCHGVYHQIGGEILKNK